MRILTFTTLFPNRSYPERGVFIRERMHRVASLADVEVVAPVPAAVPLPGVARAGRLASVPREEEIAGLRVHHPRYLSVPGEWPRLKPRSIARGARATVDRLHARAPFDLVDAHFAHPDGAAAARVAERLGRPFVLTLRGSDIHRDLDRPRLRPLILDTVGRAAAVIAVAESLAAPLRAAGVDEEKIHVIPNGIDTARFAPRDRGAARAEIAAGFDGPLLLAVGALLPVKGFDLLLDAFPALPGDTRLWIVGDGPMREALEAQAARNRIADRVRFVGAVPHDTLPAFYAAADGFVLSSRNEGCPNVLLEALASGCPAAAARVGHVPELIEEGVNGLLAPAGDATALSAALRGLLDSQHDRARIRASVEDLTWERVARRVRDVFSKALRNAGTPVAERTSACSARS